MAKKYNKSSSCRRLHRPHWPAIGLISVVLLLTTGLCQAFNPANLTLKADVDGSNKLEISAAPYRVYFPDSLDSAVRLTSRDQRLEFTLGEMSYNAGEAYLGSPQPTFAEIGADTVVYAEAFEQVDVEYQLSTRGIKEFFVLKQRPRAPAGHLSDPTLDFTQTIDTDGLTMFVEGAPAPVEFTTERAIEFVEETRGDTIFTLPAPYAIDTAGDVIPIRYKVQTLGNKVRIHTQTPYAWLDDPSRSYPVKIDPIATLNADYSVVLEGGSTWATSWIGIGEWSGTQRTGIDFDTSTIPDSATITKVELKIYITDEGGPLGNDVASMTKKAYTWHVTDSDESGFDSDVDGNDYLSNSSVIDGDNQYHTVELLSAAATDLESQLGADWFSVGWTGTTEPNNTYRDGDAYGDTNPPQLIVTYTDPSAPDSITASPGTVAMVYDATLCGTLDKDWKNLTNATSSNNSYADFSDKNFDSGEISKRLDLTNFGFAVPDGATIDGVKVEIERYASSGDAQDEVVHLMLAGSPDTTENKALTSTAWPTSDPNSYQSYGGTTDKWSIASLSESNVENSGFGATLCVEATSNDTDADVDHVQITVYYSTTTPLTSVSNSPSPSTVSDTSTHTVAFTTADALPADGKIVVTFDAGFDLTAVGNADISSGTMDGSFTVSRSGQELTITRSGGSSQAAAAENIIIADITNTSTVGTSYTVDVETQDSGSSTINGPTTSSTFTIKGKSVLANPATQVTDKLTATDGTQPTDVALVGFKITPTGENLTWTDLVVSLTYGGGMADADITSAQIYVDNGTVGTYESGTDTQVGAQSVNAASGTLTWNTVGGTITVATDYLIIFDAGASLSTDETVQAAVTAANITVSGATSSQSITSSGSVSNEPLHTVTGCGDGQFSYRRSLVIDYNKVGADNSGTLPATGFPVLVSLSGNWLKTTTVDAVNGRVENDNGWDIVFRGSNGTTGLYHEIEDYDGTNGTLVAWVRIDSLSKAADTTFYIYYGNACVNVDPADPDNVWDASYEGVWHLVEDQSGTGNNDLYTDSTSNNYHGDDEVSATNQAGQIAAGQRFDGSNDYINLDGQGIEDHDYDAFTIETWYKSASSTTSDDQYIYTHMDSAWNDYVNVGPTDDGGNGDKIRVDVGDGGTSGPVYGTIDVVDQQWRHLAIVRTGGGAGSRIKIYVDGNEDVDAADPSGGGLIAMAASDDGPYIGDSPGDVGEDVDGNLDEVRVSSNDRDLDWIRTSFNNQDDATPGAGKFIKSQGSEATAFSTAIDLLSLSATGGEDAVQVDWETGSETGNLGFYLYRATSPYGPFVRITDQLIAGLNHSVESRAYSYADTNVTPGGTYYYKLEDLDMDGQRTFHGPVGVNWDGAGAPLVAPGDPDPAPWEPGGDTGPVTVSDSDEPVYKIMVDSEGIYRLDRDFLAGQAVALDKVDLSKVRLYHQAREAAIWVHDDNGDTVFDVADHITFYALPVADEFAKYSADNVYWLTTGEGANPVKRMAEVDSAPDGSALAAGFEATVRREQDQYYYPNAPGADELDRWLNETWVVGAEISWPGAGDPITFTLDTPGATGSGKLTVALLGTYATDHEVDISVNGGPVQTFTWSGIAFYEAVIEDAALVAGLNTISLTCQTGLDALLVDWITADYPRNFAADSDRLEFTSSSPERFLTTDFTDDQLLAFDITDPENVSRSINIQISGSGPYSLEFTPPNGAAEARTYQVLSTDAVLTPRAVTADAATNLTDAANGADYILISHRNLGWDGSGNQYTWLTDLLAHRQAQGHRVMAVNLTDIYDEFSFGLPTPAAIKDFLAYAVSFWTAPSPQYVLLVGDATYDYKDNWGYGADDDVPSYTIFTEEAGETVTDEWYVLTSGGDVVPDLSIGRLPAATAAEAQAMAAKIISYESAVNTKTWQKNIVLVSDNRTREEEAVFESMNDDAADLLPDALQPPPFFSGLPGRLRLGRRLERRYHSPNRRRQPAAQLQRPRQHPGLGRRKYFRQRRRFRVGQRRRTLPIYRQHELSERLFRLPGGLEFSLPVRSPDTGRGQGSRGHAGAHRPDQPQGPAWIQHGPVRSYIYFRHPAGGCRRGPRQAKPAAGQSAAD
ncbi:Salicylate hydroxylase (EC [Olavius algarvensis Delta 1 endosymbiont]|nr:Salicylate hydroxylase (EC [Olavius algarvensis Delta 1 endosymbiont]